MPRLNGYEVARELRGNPEMRKTYLVALTGWGQSQDRLLAKAAGFDEHLLKPIEPAQLDSLIRRIEENVPDREFNAD